MFNMARRLTTKNRKGFTLVELMAVVLIIGILVAIAIPLFNQSSEAAKIKSHKANVRTLAGAAAQYLSNNGTPASDITWNASSTGATGWAGYLKEWPANPHTNTDAYAVTIGSAGTVTVSAGTNSNLTPTGTSYP